MVMDRKDYGCRYMDVGMCICIYVCLLRKERKKDWKERLE